MKKLIPALCMLLVAASLLGTSTYAWFSMNETVTAQGMSVKAVAEAGIVIANAEAGTYDAVANSAKTTTATLKPGSTANLANWYVSKSTNPAIANTGAAYTAGEENQHYVKHEFYIRSSAAETLTVASLDVKSVTVKVGTGSSAQDLSKSLRVGIKMGGEAYIYAPITGFTTSYEVNGATTVAPISSNTPSTCTAITSLPANTANGQLVEVYIWFEGEDAACVSNNIQAVLETLSVSVVFGYTMPT